MTGLGYGHGMVTTPTSVTVRAARPSRLYSLDGLRFVAAIGVLLYHFTARWSTVWGEEPVERFGVLGHVTTYFALAPELFFVISGFVILWTAWGRTVPAVVASRVARLYPSYWTALALTSLLLLVIWPDGKRISLTEVAVNVTLLQEAFGVRHVDGVYWTLWTELRFYLLVVVLVAIGLTRRRVIAFAALWPVAGLAVEALGWDLAQTVLISRYAPLFAGGMLLFLIFRDGHTRVLWALVAGNAAIAVHNVVPAQMRSLGRNTGYDPSPVLLGVLVVACFATVAVLSLTRVAWLDWRVLTTLGALTYPLYLVHEFWGWWVIHLLHDVLPTAVTLLAATLTALALALVIHHGVEKRVNPPMRRWLERVLSRAGRSGRPGRPASTGSGRAADAVSPPAAGLRRAPAGATPR